MILKIEEIDGFTAQLTARLANRTPWQHCVPHVIGLGIVAVARVSHDMLMKTGRMFPSETQIYGVKMQKLIEIQDV